MSRLLAKGGDHGRLVDAAGGAEGKLITTGEVVLNTKSILYASAMALTAINAALAQSPAPAAAPNGPTAPVVLPMTEPRFKGELGRTFQDSDTPQFPQPPKPPKGAPNIVLILLDDAGFGQFSTFGGGTPSPNIDSSRRMV